TSALEELVAETAPPAGCSQGFTGAFCGSRRPACPRVGPGLRRPTPTTVPAWTPRWPSQPPILEAVRHGGGRRRFTPRALVDWAGGGLVSTAADLAAFLRALTRGQLLSTRAWSEMTRWHPGPAATTTTTALGWVATASRRRRSWATTGSGARSRSGLPSSTP